MSWKFQDAQNVAVITSKHIIDGSAWIAYASHDEDDGGWQFHTKNPLTENDAAVVSLKNIVEIDNSVEDLADLPLGWFAWREGEKEPWQRRKTD